MNNIVDVLDMFLEYLANLISVVMAHTFLVNTIPSSTVHRNAEKIAGADPTHSASQRGIGFCGVQTHWPTISRSPPLSMVSAPLYKGIVGAKATLRNGSAKKRSSNFALLHPSYAGGCVLGWWCLSLLCC